MNKMLAKLYCQRPANRDAGAALAVETPAGEVGDWLRKLQSNLGALLPARPPAESRLPSLFEVMATSINIMQVRIARSRMAGEPADLVVAL